MNSIQDAVDDFNSQLEDFTENLVPREALKQAKMISYEAIQKIVARTPVKSGHARAGWIATRTTYTTRAFSKTHVDPSGAETIAKAWRVINQLKAYQNIYFSNNVPYIERLEDGWSAQAPNGMVRLTVEELAIKYGLS
jgi:hypothetical protein